MSKQRKWQPEAMVTSEKSIRFKFGNQVDQETYLQVMRFSKMVEQDGFYLLEEIVPSYNTVTVYLKKEPRNPEEIVDQLLSKWQKCEETESGLSVRKLTIPVCYDEEFSLDMERVMAHTNLTANDIISLHCKPIYTVYMIGFLPGFPYLGKLDEQLATPRLHTPRFKVEKGTVGIGGHQTGIYPLDSPGGWNIIGKTPLDLYRPDRNEPFFIQAGDQLGFSPITKEEYAEIRGQMDKHPETIREFITMPEV
ncbi:5-oxoprolinase subunit PxpB [Mesobacillus maritimus]|uniref:5-oxoprolinase subunit PxpB n=1 Tax=Mesobacillus maritimus TaxID=1643336 RepID=UPI00384CF77D